MQKTYKVTQIQVHAYLVGFLLSSRGGGRRVLYCSRYTETVTYCSPRKLNDDKIYSTQNPLANLVIATTTFTV